MKASISPERQQAINNACYLLIEEENERNNLINKFLDVTPDVRGTDSWATAYSKDITDVEEKRFTYGVGFRLLLVFMTAVVIFMLWVFYSHVILHPEGVKKKDDGAVLILIPILVWVGLVVYFWRQVLKDCIVVRAAGILLGKKEYSWVDILGTYIVKRPAQKYGRKYFLVLTLVDGEVVYYGLDYYGKVFGKMGAYIEYFKGGQL